MPRAINGEFALHDIEPNEEYYLADDITVGRKQRSIKLQNVTIDGRNQTVSITDGQRLFDRIGPSSTVKDLTVSVSSNLIKHASAFCKENFGTLENITVRIDEPVKFDFYNFGGIAYENFGVIHSSSLLIKDTISSWDCKIDFGGITNINNGLIENCKFEGNIHPKSYDGGVTY